MTPPPDVPKNVWLQLVQVREERDDAYAKLNALRRGLVQYEHTLTAVEAERDEVRAERDAYLASVDGAAHQSAVEAIERLTRERDEARAQVTALIDRLAEALSGDGVRIHFRSLDEAVAEARRLTAVCASHWAEANTLRALLREVEWHGWCPTLLSSPPAHASEASIATGACPFCQRFKFNGHAPDCRLKAALEGRDA